MKQVKLLLLLLSLVLSVWVSIQYNTEINPSNVEIELENSTKANEIVKITVEGTSRIIENNNLLNIPNDSKMSQATAKGVEEKSVFEVVNRKMSWEESRDEHMYTIEVEPMKLKSLIANIAEHPELSAAEKEFAISSIRYGDKCPLECLDGYSKYEKEFYISNPTGFDPLSGLTFEESINYYASYGERVRKELEQDT